MNALHEDNMNHFMIKGQVVPTVPFICRRCGLITQYAIGTIFSSIDEFKKLMEKHSKSDLNPSDSSPDSDK